MSKNQKRRTPEEEERLCCWRWFDGADVSKRGASRFRVQKLAGCCWDSPGFHNGTSNTWWEQGAEEEAPQMSSHILLNICVEELLPELVSVEPFGLQEHLKVEGCYTADVVAVVLWIKSHLKRFHGCQLQRLDPPKPLKEAESGSSGWERSWWKLGLWRAVEGPRRCPGHHGAARACLDHSRRCPRSVSES